MGGGYTRWSSWLSPHSIGREREIKKQWENWWLRSVRQTTRIIAYRLVFETDERRRRRKKNERHHFARSYDLKTGVIHMVSKSMCLPVDEQKITNAIYASSSVEGAFSILLGRSRREKTNIRIDSKQYGCTMWSVYLCVHVRVCGGMSHCENLLRNIPTKQLTFLPYSTISSSSTMTTTTMPASHL